MFNSYQILGLPHNATQQDIQTSYTRLINSTNNEHMRNLITNAYNEINNQQNINNQLSNYHVCNMSGIHNNFNRRIRQIERLVGDNFRNVENSEVQQTYPPNTYAKSYRSIYSNVNGREYREDVKTIINNGQKYEKKVKYNPDGTRTITVQNPQTNAITPTPTSTQTHTPNLTGEEKYTRTQTYTHT